MECFLGLLVMNSFSCVNGFLNIISMFYGCKPVFEFLFLFLLFGFGLKVVKFTLYLKGFEFDRYLSDFGDKTGVFQKGFCSKDDLVFKCCSNISTKPEKDLHNFEKIHSSNCYLYDNCTVKSVVLKADFNDEFKCCSKFSSRLCCLERDVQILDKIHSSKWNLDNNFTVKSVLKGDFDDEFKCCSNISLGKCWLERDVQVLDKIHSSRCNLDDDCTVLKGDSDDYNDDNTENFNDYNEDYAFDVLALRKLVKIERHTAKSVYIELEKERMASSTAAEEAMAMILRLQNEKSLAEMEAKQYKRLSEEKQLHDQDVIRSLQWLVLKHKSERSVLEDQLRLCLQKASVQINEEEQQQQGNHEEYVCSSGNAMENGLDPRFFSSLDMDLSMEQLSAFQF